MSYSKFIQLGIIASLTLWSYVTQAQCPQGISYQAIIRDGGGQLVVDSPVSMRFIIHSNEATGTVEYDETHTTTTNSVGLVNLFIGTGTPAATTFDAIDWSNTTKYLEVQLDLGAGYTSLGTQQMMSVPFALYACSGVGEQGPQGVQGEPGTSVETVMLENNHVIVTLSDGTVIDAGAIAILAGCTDNTACNYDPNANFYNGLCSYAGGACNDSDENTINDYYTADCVCEGTPTTVGCTNPAACNYDASAFIDNGSCAYIGGTCDDGDATTNFDIVGLDCICAGSNANGAGNGATLLPGNLTCIDQNISVTGCAGQTSLDYNGHSYGLVEIGGQCWFAENLITTTLNDGITEIPQATSYGNWPQFEGPRYAYADYSSSTIGLGLLYSGHLAISEDICPVGWHVPSDCEWMYLEAFLGMDNVAQQSTIWRGPQNSYMIKAPSVWYSPNYAGSYNQTGFSALPSAGIYEYGATEPGVANFWTSTQAAGTMLFMRQLNGDPLNYYRVFKGINWGLSIRCLKD
jgi:uncharacterized protein (TIGR02145 family)